MTWNDSPVLYLLLQNLVGLVVKIDLWRMANETFVPTVPSGPRGAKAHQIAIEDVSTTKIEYLNVARTFIDSEKRLARNGQSFDGSGEDGFTNRFARTVGSGANKFVLVRTGFPIEYLNREVLFTCDIDVACCFVNRNSFTAMQVGIAIGALSGEFPCRIVRTILGVSEDFIEMRVDCIDPSLRINRNAAELTKESGGILKARFAARWVVGTNYPGIRVVRTLADS